MGQDASRKRAQRGAFGDGERFVRLPHVVLDSAAYRNLSHTARSLLVDTARQYNGKNNGRLVVTPKYLAPLGWNSADVIQRAKVELLNSGLLIETRKGARPNKAAWYMLAWHDINVTLRDGIDCDPAHFRKMRRNYQSKIIPLIPSDGIVRQQIVPPDG
jgi:hypothetical protein